MLRTVGGSLLSSAAERDAIIESLSSCATEADIVQVLYRPLNRIFGYDVVLLQVREREGWQHMQAVDHGVLQDVLRRRISESTFGKNYDQPSPRVTYLGPETLVLPGRGPGGGKRPRTVIWVPILKNGRAVGSVLYQMDVQREVAHDELAFLVDLHPALADVLATVQRNELKDHVGIVRVDRASLLTALTSCATEADIVQVLYAALHRLFGYDVVNLHVLEREGWYHYRAFDHGVLQDVGRRRVAESYFARNYQNPKATVIYSTSDTKYEQGRGFGVRKRPETLIWIPILQGGQAVGSVIYQSDARRDVPQEELAFLEDLHSHLGPVVSSAYLNELTRNQAVSLSALNSIARALASTHDDAGIVAALHAALGPLLAFDRLELIVRDGLGENDQVRILRAAEGRSPRTSRVHLRRLGAARRVLEAGAPRLRTRTTNSGEYRSAVCVPVRDDGKVTAALSVLSRQPRAYEQSTVAFLEQVGNEVALALRNARSYSAVEASRRRLEVVNAVGRRLTSTLDRWSIMRAVREELAAFVQFDIFTMATISQAPGGAVADGYVFDSGQEQPLVAVPLADSGPSRKAYERGRSIVFRHSPWSSSFSRAGPEDGELVLGDGALVHVTEASRRRRRTARSIVWVPLRHGDEITALLSLQSYRADAFDDWHVSLLEDMAAHVSLALATAQQVEARERQARMMDAILTHSPVGMVLEDARGSVLYVNAEVERIYGKSAQALIGRPSSELLADAAAVLVSDPESEPGSALEFRLPQKDMVVEVRHVPISGVDRQPAGVLSLHEDVTRERSLLEAKDLMLRAIGHEVRSPAAAMRSTLESILQWGSAVRPEQRQMLLEEAYEQSDRLLRLVESQLLVAKLETSRFEPKPAPVSLGGALDQALRVLHNRYGERVHVVRCSLAANLPPAYCEPAHLDQVLANLLGNALEYARASRVLVSASLREDWLEVTVEDNGGGLPVGRRDTLFAKTGLAGQNRARGGLGLGLYLCRLVVERSFGGRIWLDQTGPQGTTFKFTVAAAA